MDNPLDTGFGVYKGNLVGRCPKCGEPSTGDFDQDEDEFRLDCVSCSWHKTYETGHLDMNMRWLPPSQRD